MGVKFGTDEGTGPLIRAKFHPIVGFAQGVAELLARKRIPWVCYSTPNLALIGKTGSVQEPPKCPNLPKNFLPPEAYTMNAFR